MKEQGRFALHKSAIFALFMLGEAGVVIPFYKSGETAFLGFLISAICGFLMLKLGGKLLKVLYKIKTIKTVIILLVLLYSLYLAVCCFNAFVNFVTVYILPKTSPLLSAFVFLGITAVLISAKKDALYKFGVLAAPITAVLMGVLFALSFKQFSLDNISLLSLPSLRSVSFESFLYFKGVFLPTLILLFWEDNCDKNLQNSISLGYSLGFVFLGISILNSLLIFGNSMSAKLEFPYSEAIATVTAGNIFTRMDGFSYIVFFISCLIKTTVCIKLSVSLFKSIYNGCSLSKR